MSHRFVLFGATGDLARLKLFPQLTNLANDKQLPHDFEVLAIGRREFTTDQFIEYLRTVDTHPFDYQSGSFPLTYLQLDFDVVGGFVPLFNKIDEQPDDPVSYYMSMDPAVMHDAIHRFSDDTNCRILRYSDAVIATEKPFGTNFEVAKNLNSLLLQIATESQIYRIDHYLHKDTVKRIHAFKQTQDVNKSFWATVNQIEIVAAEQELVGTRASYYDQNGGAVNDWIQNHLLQILATLLSTNSEHDEKARLINSLELQPGGLWIGQYQGYRETPGVNKNSRIETAALVRLKSNIPHLAQTSILLASGKGMSEKLVYIKLDKKDTKIILPIDPAQENSPLGANENDAYYYVLNDLVNRNRNNFVAESEIEAQWKLTDDINRRKEMQKMNNYTIGVTYQELWNQA